jgi:hypothetical protein
LSVLKVIVLAALVASAPAQAHVVDSSAYRWVKPPPQWASHNLAPAGRAAELPPGTTVNGFWTPDEQLVLNWPPGALPATTVTIEVQPLDPATLGPLPDGRRANGNAYAVNLSFSAFRSPADVLLRVPEPVDEVYESDDGRTWRPLVGRAGIAGVSAVGFVSGRFILPSAPTMQRSWIRFRPLPALAAVAVAAVIGGWLWRRRLRRPSPGGAL